MIKSMTGYGKATLSRENREYQIEIKSVNHRYLDMNIKMPRTISYLEEEVKKTIMTYVKRGKVDVFITFENNSTEGRKIQINKEIASVYIKELKKLAEEENILANIEVTEISKYPDVLSIQNEQNEEKIKQELIEVTKQAVQKLVEMRSAEGSKMAQDLLQRVEEVQQNVTKISDQSTGLIQEYVVKLESRIKELLPNHEIDQNRLVQEVVIFADKCSVQEEITRLNSHIAQFKNFLQAEENIGKKLDFLIQEMNRETNTIGSKANCLEITNKVIDIKTQLENIREQIQNIE